MAKSDQKVTSPQPIWIFLWTFGLLFSMFLAAHHWYYKINSVKRADYGKATVLPQPSDFNPPIRKEEGPGGLRQVEGGQTLASYNTPQDLQ